jgi:hypothetical protein
MALTDLQRRVLRAIAKNRSPDSHIAGGSALMRNTGRVSADIDVFYDASEAVARSAESDIATLIGEGLSVAEVSPRREGVMEAVITDDQGLSVVIRWAEDSAFRFFPAVKDDVFGYRLHDLDLALNKILAMAGRREPRDYYDVVRLHQTGVPLAALAWAAPAKDPGFTPELIIDEINRNSNYRESQLQADINAPDLPRARVLKETLLSASREARDLFPQLPLEQVGHLYLDRGQHAVLPDPPGVKEGRLVLHGATLRGAWPTSTTDPAARTVLRRLRQRRGERDQRHSRM